MNEMNPLTPTEYARHREALGLSAHSIQAVQNAIRDGRIDADSEGKIPDPAAADRQWQERTRVYDQSKAPEADYNAKLELEIVKAVQALDAANREERKLVSRDEAEDCLRFIRSAAVAGLEGFASEAAIRISLATGADEGAIRAALEKEVEALVFEVSRIDVELPPDADYEELPDAD